MLEVCDFMLIRLKSLCFISIITLLLSGCSQQDDQLAARNIIKIRETISQETGLINIKKVGVTHSGKYGNYELIKTRSYNQVYNINPIEAAIKNIKIIKLSDISSNASRFLKPYGYNQLQDEIYFLSIDFQFENKADRDINFYGIDTIVLNNKKQLNVRCSDIYYEDTAAQGNIFYGKTKLEDRIVLILNVNPSEINSVKFIFDRTRDAHTFEVITQGQQGTLNF